MLGEQDIEAAFIRTLESLKYSFPPDIRDHTYYFANNNTRHFSFNAEERFLPVYEFADENNQKITHLDSFAERFLKKCDLGKTLTSFKASTLLKENDSIHKCVFVVDRKDLDRQTCRWPRSLGTQRV
jgi:type I restriction enzyme, R subunit